MLKIITTAEWSEFNVTEKLVHDWRKRTAKLQE